MAVDLRPWFVNPRSCRNAVDVDGDGQITKEEFVEHMNRCAHEEWVWLREIDLYDSTRGNAKLDQWGRGCGLRG